jgi:hypothetical protein
MKQTKKNSHLENIYGHGNFHIFILLQNDEIEDYGGKASYINPIYCYASTYFQHFILKHNN